MEEIYLRRIAEALDKIVRKLDDSELEDRVKELESKVAAFPQVMEFIKGYNCCGYHD